MNVQRRVAEIAEETQRVHASPLRLLCALCASAVPFFLLFVSPSLPRVLGQSPPWPPAAERRFEEARALSQEGKFADAARGYREVADWPEGGDFPERAQALFLHALMLEDARELERAIESYREVERRFPSSPFASRARDGAARLSLGGARGLEFQRAYQAAWDVLYPAEDLARRGRLEEARPGLERAAPLFSDLLARYPDDPRAKDAAASLADALLALGRLDEARSTAERALELSRREASKPFASEGARKDVAIREERLHECVRAIRRERLDLAGRVLALALAVVAVAARPWRHWTRARTRLALPVAAAVAGVASLSALVAREVLAREDVHEAALDHGFPGRAFVLVLGPGLLGSAVALALAARLPGRRGALVAGTLGAVAALALATSLLRAFELFPLLDQEL